jgi:hypothetical protein
MVETPDYDEDDQHEEVEHLRQDLSDAYGRVVDDASEVDVYLADSMYEQVKQAIESLAALVTSAEVTNAIEIVALCPPTERRDLPGGDVPPIPALALAQLPAKAGATDDDIYDEFTESLRERERHCADHIRRLFDVAAELLTDLETAAGAGDAAYVKGLLDRLAELPKELLSAYELWELCLADLYNENPGNLGSVGDMVASVETWLPTRATN